MHIRTLRLTLRDFAPSDRAGFVAYQMDPRYRRLYDLDEDPGRASELFDRFVSWQVEEPRRNFQVGVFDTATHRLCGCAGLRGRPGHGEEAVLGIELAPSHWGRYRVAIDAVACLIEHGFSALRLRTIVGDTASGNDRVRKLALWFGAKMVDQREGPEWMRSRGWHEVDWALTADDWWISPRRQEFLRQLDRASA